MNLGQFPPSSGVPCRAPVASTGKRPGPAAAMRFAQTSLLALSMAWGVWPARAADADSGNPSGAALRAYIGAQVGGIKKLQVPARDEDLPVPRNPDGTMVYRYETTPAKRYLGKLLFHDPVRTVRIDKNKDQPVDLPGGTAFGGTISAANPNVQSIIDATKQTGSCGSCHIGEAAGKAGQVLNFNVGGEGRGYTDAQGNFFPRRRPQSILTQQRSQPIFPGDALVDVLPTLTDVDLYENQNGTRARVVVADPSRFYHPNPPSVLLQTGRLDELDSVGRESPSMVGAGFNNRLLLGGFAGQPKGAPGSLNPNNDPAQENLTLLLLDAHRMLNFEAGVLKKIPAFVKLFKDAFPQERAVAEANHNLDELVSDDTVLRATATFLRTAVTRNTPFDRFLAGDDGALDASEQRGARLFFTPANSGGAGCFSCHSGPMLNKQPNDPDVTGMGKFVNENFFNVGIGDHPVQALNALARRHLSFNKLGADGFPYHAEDNGREEITRNPADAFRFRSLTMRQLKGGRTFFHNGSFTNVRDVVEYFNAGIPQDPTAGAAPTLSARFTHPRGPGETGLGLTEPQVDDITHFLEHGLYDPALVTYDPNSTTDTFQPNVRDLTYSQYHKDLAALGAKDGLMPSGLAIDDNDPLARRDEGLEFLNVTVQCAISPLNQHEAYRITNIGATVIDTNLLVVVTGLPAGVQLLNASGTTSGGDPYLRLYLQNGVLDPGGSVIVRLNLAGGQGSPDYKLTLLSGQGLNVSFP